MRNSRSSRFSEGGRAEYYAGVFRILPLAVLVPGREERKKKRKKREGDTGDGSTTWPRSYRRVPTRCRPASFGRGAAKDWDREGTDSREGGGGGGGSWAPTRARYSAGRSSRPKKKLRPPPRLSSPGGVQEVLHRPQILPPLHGSGRYCSEPRF